MSTTFRVNTVRTPEGFSLDPLYFGIQFTGSCSSFNVPDDLPIKVSVQIPDEYQDRFTHSLCTLECTIQPIAGQDHRHYAQELRPESFPFFPLPSTFNPLDSRSWQTLATVIESHLVHVVDEDRAYLIAREFFWMAFVAAFPMFPLGVDWPTWNPRINMSGDFVTHWIAECADGEAAPESIHKAREFIWDEFQMLASYVLPFPIFV